MGEGSGSLERRFDLAYDAADALDGKPSTGYGYIVRTKNGWILLLGCMVLSGAAHADVLNRLKRKLNDAKSEVQEVRNDVDAVAHADEHIESAANQAIPTQAQIENRAAAEVESTAAVQAVRETERDANAVATADERAVAAVQGEIGAVEREVENALDVEGRAQSALNRTEAVAAARELERDANTVLTADERAELALQRERAELERAATLE